MSLRSFVVLLAWSVSPLAVSAQTELTWKFKLGDIFYNEVKQHTFSTITIRSQLQTQDLKQTVVCRLTVLEVRPDGTVVLERRVVDLAYENAAGLPQPAKIAELMKDMTFQLTLDPKQRRIIKLDGYEDFMRRLEKLEENAAKTMRALLPPEALIASLEADFFHLPDRPVKKGNAWTNRFKMPMGPMGNLVGANEYKYEEVQGPQHRFSFTTKAKFEAPPANQPTPLGMQFSEGKLEIKETKGTVLFDAAHGRILEATSTMKFNITLYAEVNGQKIDMALAQTTTQTSRFLDKNPLERKPAEKK